MFLDKHYIEHVFFRLSAAESAPGNLLGSVVAANNVAGFNNGEKFANDGNDDNNELATAAAVAGGGGSGGCEVGVAADTETPMVGGGGGKN
ncbi:hypothetical protein DERF_013086 [Dermatophagoides farinae]|uniref:Uncharacterized protein n=1 Tax=Dermatophagoides farinae TaxID=6954 RepID=A0A922HL78_DERFA|nr:hypothetical protein DERF_013086 [Dermatophagoides farinae]